DGDTSPKERLSILQRFQSGTTKVLTNYEILIEGYDYQDIDCVFCIRPTQSATLWLQMTGRALRVGKGKGVATIIDVTDNWRIHGLPDDYRQWSLTATSMPTTFRGAVRCEICTHIFRPLGSELEAMYADMGDDGLLVLHHQAVCPSCGADVYFTTREDERNHQRIRVRLKPGLIPEITEINLDVSSEIVTQAYWFVKSLHRQKLSAKETYEAIYKKFIAQIDKFTLGDWRKIVRIVEPGEFSSPTKKAWDLYQQGLVKHRNRLAAIAAIKQRQEQEKIRASTTQQHRAEPFKSSVVQVIKKPATLGNPVVKKQYSTQWMLALSRCIESTRNFLTDHAGLWSVEETDYTVNISIEIENVPELKAKIRLIGEAELQEAFSATFGKKASVMFRLST
ncbi:MAG TPA: helicase-related protein, partial [Candidatus Obscuribacterales bacterium]